MNNKVKIIYTMLLLGTVISKRTLAGTEGMPSMPLIQPLNSFTIQSNDQGDQLLENRGFGAQEPMVRMMNLMMVAGSGMEGMDMSGVKKMGSTPAANSPEAGEFVIETKTTPPSAQVGTNTLDLTITKDKKPAKGLKLKAQVSMTSMDMGTDDVSVKELSPGKYRLMATFSMQGPWTVKVLFPYGKEKILNFSAVKLPH